MTHRRLLCLLLLLAMAPVVARAQDAIPAAGKYVAASELPPQLLPPPPAEGSAAWRQDIGIILAGQKHVSTGTLSALRDEQHLRLSLMTDVVGGITPDSKPATYALLAQVLADTEGVSEADKRFWHTRRPYLADSRVQLMVDRIDSSPSYPSGHTSGSRVLAEVMGMLYPAKLDALRQRADTIADDRIVAGVHYPTDIAAGRMVAMLVIGSLLKDEAFRRDLAEAQAETGVTY